VKGVKEPSIGKQLKPKALTIVMAHVQTSRGLTELRKLFRDEINVYGKRVLDIGCGKGRAVLQADNEGAKKCVGLDVDFATLRSQWGVNFKDLWHNLSWKEGSRSEVIKVKTCEDLPVKDASFDIVICSFIFPYVEDKLALLKEVVRVLAPGGRAYIVNTEGYSSYTSVLRAWSNAFLLADERCGKRLKRLKKITEERELTYDKWRKETDPDAAEFGSVLEAGIAVTSEEKEFRVNDMKMKFSNFYALFRKVIEKSDHLKLTQSGLGVVLEKSARFEEKEYSKFVSRMEKANERLMMNINLCKQDELRPLPAILSVFDRRVLD
jgi:ubiquinone/menaquinone biosynthesis C-methylase UbiE